MKSLFRLVLLAVLIALGFWAWTILFPNPQKVIRNRLNKLARLASFSANEGNISHVANIQKLGLFFTDEIEVKVDVPGYEVHTFSRREELTQAAMAAKGAVGSLKAEFSDIRVVMGPDNQSAVADLTSMAHVGGDKNPLVQVLKFYFKKVNGEWLINRVDTVQTL